MLELKRIAMLSGPDRLAIQVLTDAYKAQVSIDGGATAEVGAGDVYIFPDLQPLTCYHVTATAGVETLTTAFQTCVDMPPPPRARRHAGGAALGGW